MSAPRTPGQADLRSGAAVRADTVAAIATSPGRSAIAVVRVTGPAAFAVASKVLRPWPLVDRAATVVTVHSADTGEVIDQALATVFAAPRSFTGEHVVEVSSHGGAIAPTNVLRAFISAGARPAPPGEFTRRALLNGKLDLIQAEALGDLIDAPTSFTHKAALTQLSGALTRRISTIREALLELEALIAYDVDFPEEDEGPVAPQRVRDAALHAAGEIRALLETLPAARIGREGAVVVLAGIPNAGKSSLFNTLLGEQRAIVTEHPGTTRDAVDALVERDPYPFRLIDTAGLRDTTDAIERMGVEVSSQWLARADVVLVCGPTSQMRRDAMSAVAPHKADVIQVRTMADLQLSDAGAADVAVSSHTGEGVTALLTLLTERLLQRYPLPSSQTPVIMRARHEAALRSAHNEINSFVDAWTARRLPVTVAAVHVRAAVDALDGLIGAVDVEDVLTRLFERFCVGK